MTRKVIILTGFLGSGKTTILRGIVSKYRDSSRITAIINELGEVSLDHYLVRTVGERVRLLGGGCACCNVRDDLVNALREELSLEMRGVKPVSEYVVVETTGLTDPSPISFTIETDPVLQHHYRVHKIVTVVSALNGEEVLRMFDVARKQLAMADLVVVTKVDLAPLDEKLASLISSINPAAEVVQAVKGDLEPEIFLADARTPQRLESGGPALAKSSLLSVVFDGEVDWAVFGVWLSALLYVHGDKIPRVKAVIRIGGGDFVILNGVQHVIHAPEHFRAGPGERSRLMMVTMGVEPERILESFQVFHSALGGASSGWSVSTKSFHP
ncbi:putative GTP-binding protein YjiA [archaeon HR01]|nr:putative GTP-binding protein YjiA [archaeon HR01]